MRRRPPRSTRTDTPFPYTTLFRSASMVMALANRTDHASDFGTHHQRIARPGCHSRRRAGPANHDRSEEHTSELQSLMRISYAVFCLKTKITIHSTNKNNTYLT